MAGALDVIQAQCVDEIRGQLSTRDFAIVDLLGKPADREVAADEVEAGILRLAEALGLGRPFTPDLYRGPESRDYTTGSGVNHVGGPASGSDHPAFSSRSGLDLHTDATLQPIGAVPITIFGTVREATAGGDTIVFRAAALVETLLAHSAELLAPLFDPLALRRHTTVGTSPQHADGPVFEMSGAAVLGRYCTTPRDEWRFEVVPGLKSARTFLESHVNTTPGVIETFRLKVGQAIIIDNSRASHGRTAFQEDPRRPRHIVRALFDSKP